MEKYDIEKHGVTQSVLLNWLGCRERARLGLKGWSRSGFSPSMQYGEIFHGALERVFKKVRDGKLTSAPSKDLLHKIVGKIVHEIEKRTDTVNDQGYELLEYNRAMAEAQLPTYFARYSKDFTHRKWVLLETEFNIPIKTRDGIIIPFRGKIDAGFEQDKYFSLFETKTKSIIDTEALMDQLHFDFQTTSYIYAAWKLGHPLARKVLYNVIRRPGLRKRKTETIDAFMERVRKDIIIRKEFYFMRWEIAITQTDIDKFMEEFEDIVTEFHRWYVGKLPNYRNTGSCQTKYGACQYVGVCARKDYKFLEKRERVFPELGEIK